VNEFDQSKQGQELKALKKVVEEQGNKAISSLYEGSGNSDLRVRSFAYEQLKILGEASAELERGIPLRSGDTIYAVYQSGISWEGDWHIISGGDNSNSPVLEQDYRPLHKQSYHTKQDSAGNTFQCLSDSSEDSPPRIYWGLIACHARTHLFAYCVDGLTAQAKKEQAYMEAFAQLPCHITCIRPNSKKWEWDDEELRRRNVMTGFDLRTWVEENEISVENADARGWNRSLQIAQYSLSVIDSLYKQERFDLLRDIWSLIGHKPLASVCKYHHQGDYPCYLQIHNR
jgi:hypothetical protein